MLGLISQLATNQNISPRYDFSSVHDSTTNSIYLIGGSNGAGILSDIWILNGLVIGEMPTNPSGYSLLSQLTPMTNFPSRSAFSSVLVPVSNTIYIIGGTGANSVLSDIWTINTKTGFAHSNIYYF